MSYRRQALRPRAWRALCRAGCGDVDATANAIVPDCRCIRTATRSRRRSGPGWPSWYPAADVEGDDTVAKVMVGRRGLRPAASREQVSCQGITGVTVREAGRPAAAGGRGAMSRRGVRWRMHGSRTAGCAEAVPAVPAGWHRRRDRRRALQASRGQATITGPGAWPHLAGQGTLVDHHGRARAGTEPGARAPAQPGRDARASGTRSTMQLGHDERTPPTADGSEDHPVPARVERLDDVLLPVQRGGSARVAAANR